MQARKPSPSHVISLNLILLGHKLPVSDIHGESNEHHGSLNQISTPGTMLSSMPGTSRATIGNIIAGENTITSPPSTPARTSVNTAPRGMLLPSITEVDSLLNGCS